MIRKTRALGRMAGWPAAALLAGCTFVAGCGSNVAAIYPNELVGADGQRFTVADLEAVANDPDLDQEAKRDAFRALGIEDEALIDALLEL